MKVVVLGAGAMGSLFGGLLKKAGNDVLLVDVWQAHVSAISRSGLIIEADGREQIIPVPACLPEAVGGKTNLILIFTKSFHTAEALDAVREIISDDTWAMTLQNGVGHVEIIEQFIPAARIIHGITTYPCDIVAPGHIRTRYDGYVKMMSVDQKPSSRLDAVSAAFNKAGFNCEVTPEVRIAIWEKLAFNAAMNALSAVLRLSVGQVGQTEDGRELARQIVDEVVSVAHHKKIFVDRQRIMETISMAFTKHRDHKPSMLQDILKKRKTEIDFINGAVIREARRFDLGLPVNEVICRLVKIVESASSKN